MATRIQDLHACALCGATVKAQASPLCQRCAVSQICKKRLLNKEGCLNIGSTTGRLRGHTTRRAKSLLKRLPDLIGRLA